MTSHHDIQDAFLASQVDTNHWQPDIKHADRQIQDAGQLLGPMNPYHSRSTEQELTR